MNLRIFADEDGKMNLSVSKPAARCWWFRSSLCMAIAGKDAGRVSMPPLPPKLRARCMNRSWRLRAHDWHSCRNRRVSGAHGGSLVNDGPVTLLVESAS